MYGCVRTCAPFLALCHIACLVAAIWLHAIRVPPSKALALANMAGEEGWKEVEGWKEEVVVVVVVGGWC